MERKKYNTKQKEIILRFLKDNNDKDLTVEEIMDNLKKNNLSVGETTVYRFIENLVKEEKVRKYLFENKSRASYQYVENKKCEEHFHLKCTKCNKLIHLDCDEFKAIEEHILDEHDFEVCNSKTVLYGICKDCKKSNQ